MEEDKYQSVAGCLRDLSDFRHTAEEMVEQISGKKFKLCDTKIEKHLQEVIKRIEHGAAETMELMRGQE